MVIDLSGTPDPLTNVQAAEAMRIARGTVGLAAARGQFPNSFREGEGTSRSRGRLLIPRSDVAAVLIEMGYEVTCEAPNG